MQLQCFIPHTVRDSETGETHYTGFKMPAGYVTKDSDGNFDICPDPVSLSSIKEIKAAILYFHGEGEDLRFEIIRI